MKCKRCGKKVKKSMYETGIEEFCLCQCTLDADFDESLWEKND